MPADHPWESDEDLVWENGWASSPQLAGGWEQFVRQFVKSLPPEARVQELRIRRSGNGEQGAFMVQAGYKPA